MKVERVVVHVCRNPATGVWEMMRLLCAAQTGQPGTLSMLGVLSDRRWPKTSEAQLAACGLRFLHSRVPTLFGTGAYLLFILSNPVRGWVRRLRAEYPDASLVLHFHTAWMTGAFLPLPRRSRAAAVATFHGVADRHRLVEIRWLRIAHQYLTRRLLKSSAVLTAVSESTVLDAEEVLCADPRRFIVVANGLGDREGLRRRPPGASSEFVVGHVGQLHRGKGWHLLLEAVDKLRSEGAPVRLVLAGRGQDEAEVAAAASERSGYVEFRGFVPDAGRCVIPELDALVLGSWTEGMPMSVVEAFAAGTTVVATDAGGLKEMVRPGENGLRIERTAKSVTNAIRVLLNDRELCRQLGSAGRCDFERRYQIDEVVSRYDAVYSRALELIHEAHA